MENFLPRDSLPRTLWILLVYMFTCEHTNTILLYLLSFLTAFSILYPSRYNLRRACIPLSRPFSMQSYGNPRLLQVPVANSLLSHRLPGNPSTFFFPKWVFQKLCTSIPCLWAYGHRFFLHRKRHKATTSHR